MKITDVLSSDPEIVSGAVVFKGTRVPVDALFENMAHGMSIEEFVDNFPTVERAQAQAVLKLAAQEVETLGHSQTENFACRSRSGTLVAQEFVIHTIQSAIHKANVDFYRWTMGETLWGTGVEAIMEIYAAQAFNSAAKNPPNTIVSLQFGTGKLLSRGYVFAQDFRHGRIDMVVETDRPKELYAIEFKRYLNPAVIDMDCGRLAQIVSAAKSQGVKSLGILAGPMYQVKNRPYRFGEEYGQNLRQVKLTWPSIEFSYRVSDDQPFNRDFETSKYDSHLSVIILVSAI